MKYLITGGLGFIGTKIIEKLTNDGHTVVCVDNTDTYGIISQENLNKLIVNAIQQLNIKNHLDI